MAAIELPEGTYNVDKDGTITATRVFRVFTGNAAHRPAFGVAGIAINRYNAHPEESSCLAVGVSSDHLADQLGWFNVTYTYTNKPFEAGTTDSSASPGDSDRDLVEPPNRTPTVRWSHSSHEVPFELDYDSPRKPVCNSAGEPFEGQTVECINEILTISFYTDPTKDIGLKQDTYGSCVNDDAFAPIPGYTPYPEGTLRCNSWSGELAIETNWGIYLHVDVELEFNPNGWHRDILDCGTSYKVEGEYVNFVQVVRKFRDNALGQTLDGVRKLNGIGGPLNPGDNPVLVPPYFVVDGGTDNVSVYKRFYPYEWVDFTNLFT